MTVIIQECAGYLEERFQIEQCPIDAGSPLGNGFLCPLEFEQPDMGKTWAQYDLKEFGPRSAVRFHRKNSDGWFRVDLRKGWIDRADVMFIKPK